MKVPNVSGMAGTVAPLPQKSYVCTYIPLLMITLLIVQIYFSSDPPIHLSQQDVDSSNVSGPSFDSSPSMADIIPSIPGTCDLSKGEWVDDFESPLYSYTSCPYIQEHQNCLKNGRPDLRFLNWRWKPIECDLPRFDGHRFLSTMAHKTMAFIGDSIARNHMQSLLCTLSQTETPTNLYRDEADRFLTWSFPSYNFSLAILWSPYLIKTTEDAYNDVPQGVMKLFLDIIDEKWTGSLSKYDYVILSSGQWYFKTGVYISNGEVLGCHYCPGLNLTEVGFFSAYETALLSVYKYLLSRPQYTGVTILRTLSPDHFDNGTWSTGGTCLRTMPFKNLSANLSGGISMQMRGIQLKVFVNISVSEPAQIARLKLLDITYPALLRPDGHPGPYRYAKYLWEGKAGHVQNDCLHWCLPGPIDAWNEMLLKMLS